MEARLALTDCVDESDPKLILAREDGDDQLWIQVGEEGNMFALSHDDVSVLIAFITAFGGETV